MKLLILVPTRGRPDNCERLRISLMQTAASPSDVDVVFLIDSDDPRLVDYLILGQNPSFYYQTGPSKRLGPWLNDKAVEWSEHYDAVAFIGDDVISRTRGWDLQVKDALWQNRMVYVDDGLQGENLPTAVFMTSELIQKAGYMVYPELTHLYIDNHWKAWGESIDSLKYLPDVLLEHMHPYAQKADMDETYEAANHPDMYDADKTVFHRFLIDELPELTKRCG